MTFKIGIFGSHPQIRPGFFSSMSINLAAGFHLVGVDVTLYIGSKSQNFTLADKLRKLKLHSSDGLDRYDLNFDIKIISNAGDYDQDIDCLIWQSYDAHDDASYFPNTRNFLVTKSFPRCFARTSPHAKAKLTGIMGKFDKVAMALRVDVNLAHEMMPEAAGTVGYVPRGFNSEWLLPTEKTAKPAFACDSAVKAEDGGRRAVEHMRLLFDRLRISGAEFGVLATRGAAEHLKADVRIPALPVKDFYARFLNKSWFYLPCDFEFSTHSKNKTCDANGKTVYIGLFENQIVEAQMAGSIPLVREGDIDTDLIFDSTVCCVPNYDDIELLAERYFQIMSNFDSISARARNFAISRFSLDRMCRSWLDLMTQ